MTLPSSWPIILPGAVDARDDGDSQLAVKFRDRQHLLTEKGINLSHPAKTAGTGGANVVILLSYRFFPVDAEKLRYVFDGKSSDGLMNARIHYVITPVTGSAVSGFVDSTTLPVGYARTSVVITLNSDIRGDHALVDLQVQRQPAVVQTVTVEATQNDNDAVVSRTFWDTDV